MKTGFLVSAFKDSDDMEGKKANVYNDPRSVASYVQMFLTCGYETVMVERSKP